MDGHLQMSSVSFWSTEWRFMSRIFSLKKIIISGVIDWRKHRPIGINSIALYFLTIRNWRRSVSTWADDSDVMKRSEMFQPCTQMKDSTMREFPTRLALRTHWAFEQQQSQNLITFRSNCSLIQIHSREVAKSSRKYTDISTVSFLPTKVSGYWKA